MKGELEKVQKGIKTDTIILKVICIFFGLIVLVRVGNIIEYAGRADSDFQVKLADTDTTNGTRNYYLFIAGEQYYSVDYNLYGRLDSEGNTNVKVNVIMEEIKGMLNCLIIECIFLVIYQMLWRIKAGDSPFGKKSVVSLRWAAVLSIMLALVPTVVEGISSVVMFQYVCFRSNSINFYICSIGVVFGILSEIFRYGCTLQEEMNQIA